MTASGPFISASCSVNERPRATRTPSAAKYAGDTASTLTGSVCVPSTSGIAPRFMKLATCV